MFVFHSKRANRSKTLAWDGYGLLLPWKCLEQNAFLAADQRSCDATFRLAARHADGRRGLVAPSCPRPPATTS
ncbi:IS66 family insertion sequence element accessory protein TnpB [Bradyrhizobium sp. 25ACV]